MCSAQPIIKEALMWSLGGTEASYYCHFMTTFTFLLSNTTRLPSFPPAPSLAHFPVRFFPSILFSSLPPSTPLCLHNPNPHPFFLVWQLDTCLFLVCKPSWHTSPGQRADIAVLWRGRVQTVWSRFVEVGNRRWVWSRRCSQLWQLWLTVIVFGFWIIGLVTIWWHPAMDHWWVGSAYVYVSRPGL